jgi:mono/diheme cytochrome c family protein
MKKAFTASMALLLAGCLSTKVSTTSPNQTDIDRVSDKYPGYTLAALNQGKNLYEQHCGNCHALKNPLSQPEKKWVAVVPVMVKKANEKFGPKISTQNQEEILRYVVTMSGAIRK